MEPKSTFILRRIHLIKPVLEEYLQDYDPCWFKARYRKPYEKFYETIKMAIIEFIYGVESGYENDVWDDLDFVNLVRDEFDYYFKDIIENYYNSKECREDKRIKKKTITENKFDSTRSKLVKSIRKFGFNETLNRFSLSFKTAEKIFQGTRLLRLTCCSLEDVFYELYKESPKRYESKDGKMRVELDYDTALRFTVISEENKDSLEGYATPYYDCVCEVPIDFRYYIWKSDGKTKYDEIENYFTYSMVDKEFRSIPEMRDWFLNDYPEILIKYAKEVFKDHRR
jgi:hypothetical protein